MTLMVSGGLPLILGGLTAPGSTAVTVASGEGAVTAEQGMAIVNGNTAEVENRASASQQLLSGMAAGNGGGNASIESGSKTNFDNEIPRSGSEWNEYLKGKYGADNVHWNINSVNDIFSDPTRLKGYTADELQKVLSNDWTRGVYGSNGGGWKLMKGGSATIIYD